MRLLARMVLIGVALWAIRSLLFIVGDFWSLVGIAIILIWGLWQTKVKGGEQ